MTAILFFSNSLAFGWALFGKECISLVAGWCNSTLRVVIVVCPRALSYIDLIISSVQMMSSRYTACPRGILMESRQSFGAWNMAPFVEKPF